MFADAFRTLLAADNRGPYIWLGVINFCTAIQAFSDFEFNGRDQQRFIAFVEKYFPAFVNAGMHLSDPRRRGADDNAQTPAEHLYKFFRSGLAHNFCIEWGGLNHREELPLPVRGYLFEVSPGAPGLNALGVVPRDFVVAYHAAVDQFFATAAGWPDQSAERRIFDRCFTRVFLLKERPPIP